MLAVAKRMNRAGNATPPADVRNTKPNETKRLRSLAVFLRNFCACREFCIRHRRSTSARQRDVNTIMVEVNAGLQGYMPCGPARGHEVESFAYGAIMERYAWLGEGDTCLILTDGYENKEISNGE